MAIYIPICVLFIGVFFILYYFEKKKRVRLEGSNEKLQNIINQLDSQTKIIIKADMMLNKAQEGLDRKITVLYTLHEFGRKTSATSNVENQIGRAHV